MIKNKNKVSNSNDIKKNNVVELGVFLIFISRVNSILTAPIVVHPLTLKSKGMAPT